MSAHVRVCTLSNVQLFANPWTAAHQAPLSMGFPRKNTGAGCHFLLQGDLPEPGINTRSPALVSRTFPNHYFLNKIISFL